MKISHSYRGKLVAASAICSDNLAETFEKRAKVLLTTPQLIHMILGMFCLFHSESKSQPYEKICFRKTAETYGILQHFRVFSNTYWWNNLFFALELSHNADVFLQFGSCVHSIYFWVLAQLEFGSWAMRIFIAFEDVRLPLDVQPGQTVGDVKTVIKEHFKVILVALISETQNRDLLIRI